MTRRGWTNLALALALGALALLAVFRPGLTPPPAPPPLTALDAKAIERVEIERPAQERIVLERRGADWRLTAPFDARASRFRIDNLLRIATAASEWQAPAAGEDLARYGLDRPQAIVRLATEELRFGALHPLKSQQYVLAGGTVHLVAASHFHSAATRLEDFLDSALLEAGTELRAMELPGLALERGEKGWQLRPANPDIASDRVQRLVEEWRHARALAVTRAGKQAPAARIRLQLTAAGADAPRTLAIGIVQRTPELVLRRADEGLDYRFAAEAAERLLQLPPEQPVADGPAATSENK